ncbi:MULTISPECIES: DUF4034 domain-containing protein [unclassified Duganella]|uniref:DUF4034 domain-containing protein n=1 Tax=unclassified Duganella TaxID=2636909 RepID=UPI0006F4479A|nr:MULTISPECIES: DUF4034 domain-containing protein [unclassified Duganella]KQV45824.1 hypothetical protein ASD07_15080 [Duganella sp. Root336D2]KRC03701.1 hypothetical protein ASE26_02380 [Duganella sp. Root198D2]
MSVHESWRMDRFQELDQQLQALCAADSRLPDGQPELLVFVSAFYPMFDAWRDWDRVGAKLKKWRSESPDSAAQAIVEVMYWDSYAWYGRGGGYASSVPEAAWELFRERLAKASARLEESKAMAGNCPVWHSLNISTLINSGASRTKINSAYAEAVKAFPASQQVHFAMGRSMEVKWGANPGDFERFARQAVKLSQREEGDGLYARLFWSRDCNCDDALSFGRPGDPDWKTMKAGFEDLLQRYPDQIYNKNKFAAFACRANDRATYAKLRRELGDNIVEHLWPDSWKPEVCDREMAKSPAVAPAREKKFQGTRQT